MTNEMKENTQRRITKTIRKILPIQNDRIAYVDYDKIFYVINGNDIFYSGKILMKTWVDLYVLEKLKMNKFTGISVAPSQHKGFLCIEFNIHKKELKELEAELKEEQ